MRALDAAPDPTPRTAQLVARLGQPIFGHQAPNGWPETSEAWMNTGRDPEPDQLRHGGGGESRFRVPRSTGGRTQQTSARRPARRAGRRRRSRRCSAVRCRRETREILTTGVHPMVAKAAADSSASMVVSRRHCGSDPAMADDEPPARRRQRLAAQGFGNIPELTGLAQVVGLALGSPEFQRR